MFDDAKSIAELDISKKKKERKNYLLFSSKIKFENQILLQNNSDNIVSIDFFK